jgi:hypothetical protein
LALLLLDHGDEDVFHGGFNGGEPPDPDTTLCEGLAHGPLGHRRVANHQMQAAAKDRRLDDFFALFDALLSTHR